MDPLQQKRRRTTGRMHSGMTLGGSTVRGSGLTTRTRTEFYDFQLGAAPTADKMRLPTGFVVQESLCSACSGNP